MARITKNGAYDRRSKKGKAMHLRRGFYSFLSAAIFAIIGIIYKLVAGSSDDMVTTIIIFAIAGFFLYLIIVVPIANFFQRR